MELCDRVEPEDKPYEKNVTKNVMMPGNAKIRHIEIEKRNLELAEAANTLPINVVEMNDTKIGVITSGIPYQYVKEALPDASVLKLGMVNPLPRKLIEDFASKVDTLYIVEELDPVIEEQVKSWGIECTGKEIFTVQGEYSANMLREAILKQDLGLKEPAKAPGRPPILCPGCPHRSVFYVLNKLKMHAAGDIGCYTLGAGGASERDRHDHVHGLQHFYTARDGEGKGQRLHKELGGSDRGFHIHAHRREFPDEHGIQQCHRHGHHHG